MIKLDDVDERRGLLSTAGWDQFSPIKDGDDASQLVMSSGGALGAHGVFGDADGEGGGGRGSTAAPRMRPNTWHALSMSVDAVGGVISAYVDGELAATIRSSKVVKDGQDALKGRLALFWGARSSFYLRHATIHSRALDGTQVASEHEMLHRMLTD